MYNYGILPGNTYSPYVNPAANNYENGIPMHTQWDVYAEKHNPLGYETYIFDTPDAHNGAIGNFTNFSEAQNFNNPDRPITWFYDQNYQGESPLELQPLLNLPQPWMQ